MKLILAALVLISTSFAHADDCRNLWQRDGTSEYVCTPDSGSGSHSSDSRDHGCQTVYNTRTHQDETVCH